MITEKTIQTICTIHNCIQNNLKDIILEYTSTMNSEEIAENLIGDDILPQNKNGISYPELLKWFIELCSYIEEETNSPAIISDEMYDKLVAKLIDIGEEQPIGSPISITAGLDEKPHEFPELRGSLAKVHFIWEREIPKKDSRKSLEGYLKNVVRQMKLANIPVGKTTISLDMKYDGVSHIIEAYNKEFQHILTRGDVGANMGKELTSIFTKFFPSNIDETSNDTTIDTESMTSNMQLKDVPIELWSMDSKYGIKVETYMLTDLYEKYELKSNDKKCNRRSAVVSICNQSPDNVSYNDNRSSYLRMMHFQISSEKPIDICDTNGRLGNWYPIGKVNGRFQYLYVKNTMTVDLSDIDGICEMISNMKEDLRQESERLNIPIDGVVLTLLDGKLVELLGRKNDKNMFQVAFKFPAGVKKTIVDCVDFQIGPIAGLLTPVARLKPIKINGNTISNVTVCNKAKLERLNLHEGDEVIIQYDIIPSIFKDSTCKESDNPVIKFPTHCPMCGGTIENERCTNPDCPSKLIGHIINFIDKNRIKGGIGIQTIVDLVEYGFLDSIGDLYRLYQRRDELYNLPGYGKTSIDNLINGISESRKMYPHELLGSIGIPSIGLKKMEKICRNLNVIGNLDHLEDLLIPAINIPGIGEKTAKLALIGIESRKDLIEDLCSNIELLPYSNKKTNGESVCFTLVRDTDFEKFLEDNGVSIKNSVTNDLTVLIIPDGIIHASSSKIKKASEKGIDIITITEAKKRWKYG